MKTKLTKREIEVLLYVIDERSSQSIANLLSISIRTVETHRKNILSKTNSNSPIGLLKFAIKEQLIEDYYYSTSSLKKKIPNTTVIKIPSTTDFFSS